MSGGYVYFITCEPDEFVKIGWSLHHPLGRLNVMQTGCPQAMRLMAFFPGSLEDERRLHLTFHELRYRGEWFSMQQKLADLVQYLSDDYPRPCDQGASREAFVAATWDVIITGYDFPHRRDLEGYKESGNGDLWLHMHPETGS